MILIYHMMHVLSIIALTAATFMAFAAPKPELRKRYLMVTGILSLLALVGGFGLVARLSYGWPAWILVKVVCWLALSALTGIAFRKPEARGTLGLIGAIAVATAVFMVYRRPF